MAVDESTATEALRFLALLQNFRSELPTVFAHGGDALVLKWDQDAVSRYLTVSGTELSLLDLRKSDGMECVGEYNLDDEQERQTLLQIVGGEPSSETSLADAP